MNENPNFTLKPIDDLKDHHFFIPDYQRGYKWDVQQVLDLLEDLKEFQQVGNSFYCLQPLAVTQKTAAKFIEEVYPELNETNKIYEVIDGQQRLTTIHIILQIIEQQGIYNINYETRKRSAKLLTAIASSDNFGDYSVVFTDKVEDLKKAINDEWAKYIKGKNNDFNNIDFYYFFTAYLTIKAWFSFPKNEINKPLFAKKIKEQVQFVWYNEMHEKDKDGKVNAKKVFRNLNSGKIPLTNSELIKALFINDLKEGNKEIQQLKQSALAREWDLIENTLQEDEFWYFINNETNKNRYQTRIDFLFELLTKKRPKNNVDKLFTYRQYAHDSAKLDWNAVKQLFLTLKEWFENRRWYHLIGFIIDREISTIREIREEIKDETIGKKDFEKHLIDKIKAKFHKQTTQEEDNKETLIYEYDLERLEYDNKGHYKYIVDILLLHNIETYQKDKSGFRFPFYRFKTTKWSLEHIHAQNSDAIKTENEAEETKNPLHTIQNLTLLDGQTNSVLKDSSFSKKRRLIKEVLTEGKHYIPICTKNVFLKYYSSTVDTMNDWTITDQKNYLTDIENTLSSYLPKTTNNDQSKN